MMQNVSDGKGSKELSKKEESLASIDTFEERLRSLVELSRHTSQDSQILLDFALHEAMRLTDSEIGYIYRYDEERQKLQLNSWSMGVSSQCSVAEPETEYDLDATGFWGEAVRQRRIIVDNDFEAGHHLKKGLPEGHVKLRRFATVPIFDGERILGVAGVANKAEPYDDSDCLHMSLMLGSAWKIVERREADRARRETEEKYELIAKNSADVISMIDLSLELEYVSPSVEQFLGITAQETMARALEQILVPESFGRLTRAVAEEQALEESDDADPNRRRTLELEHYRKNGSTVWGEARLTLLRDEAGRPSGILSVIRDITERKQAEQERERLELELLQAQKMEAIGQLAGGVAHDFNNLLTVINSYASFAIEDLPDGDPSRADVIEIKEAGERAADLVRQLLAFSRRQVMELEVVELDGVARSLEKMLRRLLGEQIEVLIPPTEEGSAVRADKGQMEQVLVNLAVNARDAMPDGGRLVIETSNVEIHEDQADRCADLTPGSFVMLSVSDTGMGMTAETKSRLFEPFFTTKEKEKGTGLGLPTVYGIVKQSGGAILVETALGKGSTFKILLPRLKGAESDPPTPKKASSVRGNETVLVVEDEVAVRAIAERALRQAGYEVLLAANGGEALLLCEEPCSHIHLLLTDVVLPHMSGKQLADRLTQLCPAMKVLYMSGYADETIARHGVLEPGINLLAKPFSAEDLTRRIREVLDEEGEP